MMSHPLAPFFLQELRKGLRNVQGVEVSDSQLTELLSRLDPSGCGGVQYKGEDHSSVH